MGAVQRGGGWFGAGAESRKGLGALYEETIRYGMCAVWVSSRLEKRKHKSR